MLSYDVNSQYDYKNHKFRQRRCVHVQNQAIVSLIGGYNRFLSGRTLTTMVLTILAILGNYTRGVINSTTLLAHVDFVDIQ